MLKWFDTREVDKFADWIASELVRQSPPEVAKSRAPKKEAQRLRKMHDAIFSRVDLFAREHQLNVYKRARLGNRVKWALLEAGYPSVFVDAFTHEIVTVVTVAGTHARKTPIR